MSESYSSIMSKYKDMSVSELGSSLLQRKEQVQAEQSKRDKKDRRIQQGLAVLLAGQGLFKNAFKRRQAELKNSQTLDLLNVEADATNIRNISSILTMVPEDFTKAVNPQTNKPYTARENTLRYFEDIENKEAFMDKIDPLLTQHLSFTNQQDFQQTNPRDYDILKESMAQTIFEQMITDDNHIKFINGLRNLTPDQSKTRDELLYEGLKLSGGKLNQYKRSKYAALEQELRRKTGLGALFNPNTYISIFKKAGEDEERQGNLNVFRRLKGSDLATPQLNEVINNLDLGGIIVPAFDQAMKKVRQSPDRYLNAMNSKANEGLRKAMVEEIIPLLHKEIDRKKAFREYGLQSYISKGLMDDLKNDLGDTNSAVSANFSKRAGALSLRLKADKDFALSLFESANPNATREQKLLFVKNINNDVFRNKFSALLVLKAGVDDPFWGGPQFLGADVPLASMGLGNQEEFNIGFKTDMGYNPRQAADKVDPYITPMFNMKTGEATEEYAQLSKQGKDNAYYMVVQQILNAPQKTENEKIQALEEFNNVTPNPLNLPILEYVEVKQKQIDEIEEQRIKEAEQAIGEVTGFSEFVGGSPRQRAERQVEAEISKEESQRVRNQIQDIKDGIDDLQSFTGPVVSFFTEKPSEKVEREADFERAQKVREVLMKEFNLKGGSTAQGIGNIYRSSELERELRENPLMYNNIMRVLNDYKEGKDIVVEDYLTEPQKVAEEVKTPVNQENLLEKRVVGEDVAKSAINAVVDVQEVDEDVKEATKNFLYEVASAESDYGTNPNTFKNPNSNATGIMQIRPDMAMKEVQRVLKLESNDVGSNVRKYNELLKEKLGIDLSTATAEDLETPLYSAAFARAYFMRVPSSIPNTPVQKANYWFDNYVKNNKEETRGTFVRRYLLANNYPLQAGRNLLGLD